LPRSTVASLIEPDNPSVSNPPRVRQDWRAVQADHNERIAKLSDAYAAAYEGDVQFALGPGQRS